MVVELHSATLHIFPAINLREIGLSEEIIELLTAVVIEKMMEACQPQRAAEKSPI
jgi:hypothetical protein